MTRGLRSTGNSVEEKTPAIGKSEEVVKEAENGEPTIYDGQHTSEHQHQTKGRPGYRSKRHSGRGDCGRKAVATPSQDRFGVERKGVSKPVGGQANPDEGCPISRCFIRANSVSDSTGNPSSTR